MSQESHEAKQSPLIEVNPSLDDGETEMQILLFRCAKRACELEFPVFAQQARYIVYCPRCKGMIVENTKRVFRTIPL